MTIASQVKSLGLPLDELVVIDSGYNQLRETAQVHEGVRFVSTKTLIAKKRARGLPKDLADIKLLEAYHE